MSVHDKINMKAEAWMYLTTAQYFQLLKRNLLALTPYYSERLIRQAAIVAEIDRYKAINGGRTRWQVENNINL